MLQSDDRDRRELTTRQLVDLIDMLELIAEQPGSLGVLSVEQRTRLRNAAGTVYCPDVAQRRLQTRAKIRKAKAEKLQRDEQVLAETGIRSLRAKPVFTTPNVFPPAAGSDRVLEVDTAQHCYVCKRRFSQVHWFYDQLCGSCADFNFRKRTESADLRGRVAVLTGGRVKIGYQAGIKLLRAGAHLIVTSRFPRDCAARYAREIDFAQWADRLEVFGLDLRHTPSVEEFCAQVTATAPRLDFIVNNACQTVRRPPEFYQHMRETETAARDALPYEERAVIGDELVARAQLFPDGAFDQDLQQVDLRTQNSWRLTLAEVSTVELLETQLVNAVAPFVLNARLKPLMLRSPERDKHIVNVSAVEGQFYRKFKTTRHPHTNMAKAALNMMTRTSAADYAADGIHMNSVDTGWVSDEDPVHIAVRKREEQRFHPPLDIVDGAARIVDPIISGFNTAQHTWGQFLKDYQPTDW